jgi:hypothetical protein
MAATRSVKVRAKLAAIIVEHGMTAHLHAAYVRELRKLYPADYATGADLMGRGVGPAFIRARLCEDMRERRG